MYLVVATGWVAGRCSFGRFGSHGDRSLGCFWRVFRVDAHYVSLLLPRLQCRYYVTLSSFLSLVTPPFMRYYKAIPPLPSLRFKAQSAVGTRYLSCFRERLF